MKKHGHYCHVCGRHRANEEFSGKGHAKHVCKDCDREHRAELRKRKRELDSRVVFVQVAAWPERRLAVKRTAEPDEYSVETGGGVWNDLKALPGARGEPIGLWLPPAMRLVDVSAYVQGVEVSASYAPRALPGFDVIVLPPCWMMLFQGSPYDKGRVDESIKVVQTAIKKFDPQTYGYEWADDDVPRVHWEPMGKRGYIEARPVRPAEKLGIAHWM